MAKQFKVAVISSPQWGINMVVFNHTGSVIDHLNSLVAQVVSQCCPGGAFELSLMCCAPGLPVKYAIDGDVSGTATAHDTYRSALLECMATVLENNLE